MVFIPSFVHTAVLTASTKCATSTDKLVRREQVGSHDDAGKGNLTKPST